MTEAADRSFLFLQGPHGPFLAELGATLAAMGAGVLRIGFNAGDAAEWPDRGRYLPFRAPAAAWPDFLRGVLRGRGVTDLVMYGDARPLHVAAAAIAAAEGVRVHWLEEGYLRPHWITHEIGGVNGASRLIDTPIARIRAAARRIDLPLVPAPDRWGAARAHAWHGAIHHARLLAGWRGYPHWQSHRTPGPAREAWLNARRLLTGPARAVRARIQGRVLRGAGRPYDVVLLQLSHDSAFIRHGPFPTMEDFIAHCITAFAAGAPGQVALVFRTHPFEDMRLPLPAIVRRLARGAGIAARVRLIDGGPLGPLLDGARAAVTVNSTAGQQALWRGLPIAALGRAIYAKPGLASTRPLADFFAEPDPPDPAAYADFRRFLLATTQLPGSFYARAGRRAAVAGLAARLMSGDDPLARLLGAEEEGVANRPRNPAADADGAPARRKAIPRSAALL
ncbi:MAG: capsule biosynthesis protein CapA [Paracoccaceae bacterium]|nr:MAG: capsule biosynthesis protein CapA [Paracoccaceae bacterium]